MSDEGFPRDLISRYGTVRLHLFRAFSGFGRRVDVHAAAILMVYKILHHVRVQYSPGDTKTD